MYEARASGIPVPALEDVPEIDETCKGTMDSFLFLHKSRNMDAFGGMSYIPLTEMQSYCSVFGIRDVQSFINMMRTLDAKYMSMIRQHTEFLREQASNG